MSFDYRNSRWALASGLLMILGGALGAGCVVEDAPSQFLYPTEKSFCDTLAKAQCNEPVVTACYGSDAPSLRDDTDACVRAASRSSNCNPKGLAYHPETADACLLKMKAAYEDAALTATEVKAVEEACIAVFNDGGKSGDGCNVDTDCDTGDGLRCVLRGDSGQCFRPHLVGAGNKCTDQADQCQSGFFCDGGGHCVSNPEVGDACDAGQSCADNAFCSEKVCVKKIANSDPCEADSQCAGSSNDGGFCIADSSGDNGRCASKLAFQFTSSNCDPFRN